MLYYHQKATKEGKARRIMKGEKTMKRLSKDAADIMNGLRSAIKTHSCPSASAEEQKIAKAIYNEIYLMISEGTLDGMIVPEKFHDGESTQEMLCWNASGEISGIQKPE